MVCGCEEFWVEIAKQHYGKVETLPLLEGLSGGVVE